MAPEEKLSGVEITKWGPQGYSKIKRYEEKKPV